MEMYWEVVLNFNLEEVQAVLRRRIWQPTPVFLPGESHGERSLVGCSKWDCKELDTIEVT